MWPRAVSCTVTQRLAPCSRQQIGGGVVRNGQPASLSGTGTAPDHVALSCGLRLETKHFFKSKEGPIGAGQMLNRRENKEKFPGGPTLIRPSLKDCAQVCTHLAQG